MNHFFASFQHNGIFEMKNWEHEFHRAMWLYDGIFFLAASWLAALENGVFLAAFFQACTKNNAIKMKVLIMRVMALRKRVGVEKNQLLHLKGFQSWQTIREHEKAPRVQQNMAHGFLHLEMIKNNVCAFLVYTPVDNKYI